MATIKAAPAAPSVRSIVQDLRTNNTPFSRSAAEGLENLQNSIDALRRTMDGILKVLNGGSISGGSGGSGSSIGFVHKDLTTPTYMVPAPSSNYLVYIISLYQQVGDCVVTWDPVYYHLTGSWQVDTLMGTWFVGTFVKNGSLYYPCAVPINGAPDIP